MDKTQTLREALVAMTEATRAIGHRSLIQEFVLANGKEMVPAKTPGFRRMRAKECFSNSSRMAVRHSELRYVEGFAWRPSLQWPIHHAWLTRDGETAIDLTWNDPDQCEYIGVIFETILLCSELTRNKVWGLLDTGRINVDLMGRLDSNFTMEKIRGK